MGLINVEIIKQDWKELLFVHGMFLSEMKLYCKNKPKFPEKNHSKELFYNSQ